MIHRRAFEEPPARRSRLAEIAEEEPVGRDQYSARRHVFKMLSEADGLIRLGLSTSGMVFSAIFLWETFIGDFPVLPRRHIRVSRCHVLLARVRVHVQRCLQQRRSGEAYHQALEAEAGKGKRDEHEKRKERMKRIQREGGEQTWQGKRRHSILRSCDA